MGRRLLTLLLVALMATVGIGSTSAGAATSRGLRLATYVVPGFTAVGGGHDAHSYWVTSVRLSSGATYSLLVETETIDASVALGLRLGTPKPSTTNDVLALGGAHVAGQIPATEARLVLLSLVRMPREEFLRFATATANTSGAYRRLDGADFPVRSSFNGGGVSAAWVLQIPGAGSSSPLPGGRPLFAQQCTVDPHDSKVALVVVIVGKRSRDAVVTINGSERTVPVLHDDRLTMFGIVAFAAERKPSAVTIEPDAGEPVQLGLLRCIGN